MQNFWQKLKKEKEAVSPDEPILVLAPMADVTDAAFRKMFAKYGKPDVTWTEFVSADGLMLAPGDNPDERGITSQDKLRADLIYGEDERPIVAQLFGSNPENMEGAARLCADFGFDGIDINMGCPDRSIEKQGSGSAMIRNPESAAEIIRAARKGAPDLPITVKTRLGYNRDILEEWLTVLLAERPAVVTLHARIRKDMSKVPARWERIAAAVKIRDDFSRANNIAPAEQTLIFGNGDITSLEQARQKTKETGCDGVMIGRGIFGNPWFFSGKVPSVPEKLRVMVEHTFLFSEKLPFKNFAVMKKHYKAYVDGFDGAKELRVRLMDADSAREVRKIVRKFIWRWKLQNLFRRG